MNHADGAVAVSAAGTAAAPSQPVLAVDELTVRFRTRGPRRAVVHAVSEVSFDLADRETLGVIGESGSGKSTIARAVNQQLRGHRAAVTGKVTLDGVRLDELSRRQLRTHRHRMQMIFQDPNDALDPRMTIRRSVEEPLRVLHQVPKGRLDEVVDAALETVGLNASMAERRPHELSGGQRQRVNIARAITLSPQVVLCDEVVSALDVSIQADILNLLAELQSQQGISYVFIAHDLGVVASISHRVAVMYLGRIVEIGPVGEVVASPLHPYTEALLSAEPEALPRSLRSRNRIILQGDIPSPISPPSGCSFRTRCRYAQERCAEERPLLTAQRDGHLVACHFADVLDLESPRMIAGRSDISPTASRNQGGPDATDQP